MPLDLPAQPNDTANHKDLVSASSPGSSHDFSKLLTEYFRLTPILGAKTFYHGAYDWLAAQKDSPLVSDEKVRIRFLSMLSGR